MAIFTNSGGAAFSIQQFSEGVVVVFYLNKTYLFWRELDNFVFLTCGLKTSRKTRNLLRNCKQVKWDNRKKGNPKS